MQQASTPFSSNSSTTDPTTFPSNPTTAKVGRRILTNTSALAASNLWRIVISFVLQLLIMRRLGLDGMGYYTIALTYLNVCQVLSEIGLPALLTRELAQQPTLRRTYFQQALVIQVGLGLFAWLVLALLSRLLPWEATSQQILLIVGASLPLYAITSVCQTLFQAAERMELIFGVEALVNTLILAGSAAILWMGGDVVRVVMVLIATQTLSAILCLLLLRRAKLLAEPQASLPFRVGKLWAQSSPFYGLALADVLLQRLDTLLLSFVGGVTITGVYGASDNLVRVLLKVVQSLWRALYPTLSRLHHQAPAKYLLLCQLSLRYGLIILLPAAAFATVVAEDVMNLVYNETYGAYRLVFQIAIWTAPAFLIELYAVTVLMVENRPLQSMIVTGIHLLVIAALLPVLTGWYGAIGAALAVMIAGAAGTMSGIMLLRGYRLPLERRRVGQIAVATLCAALFAWWLPTFWIGKVVAGAFFYLAMLWITGSLTRADLRQLQRAIRNDEAEFVST